ncbi:hypothetical protein [Xanthomonas arboricola]|nr:hypothetical protein [Xanthomonas arboricola]
MLPARTTSGCMLASAHHAHGLPSPILARFDLEGNQLADAWRFEAAGKR